jgi:hypothetical protein
MRNGEKLFGCSISVLTQSLLARCPRMPEIAIAQPGLVPGCVLDGIT